MRSGTEFIRTGTTTALLLIACAGPALAGARPQTHDGFFLRLSTGLGWAKSSISDATGKLVISGVSGDANIAVGGMVAPNLALHGTLWGWALKNPDAPENAASFGKVSREVTGTLLFGAAGVGLTFYFMPSNTYVSCSIGSGSLTGSGEVNGDSKSGFALDVTLGKEWWVGANWGLGLSGDFQYFSAKDKDIIGIDESWSGPAFGLRFSATYN